jgi:cytochrome c peroxidase
MNCHKQIWTNAKLLEPIRESWRTGIPVQWERVHDLPDFTYFHHGVHVSKGIGCSTCHGPVNEMPLIHQVAPLQMAWCLDCHNNPEKHVRPREEVFNMSYQAPPNQAELGARLVEEYDIQSLTSCSTCHR